MWVKLDGQAAASRAHMYLEYHSGVPTTGFYNADTGILIDSQIWLFHGKKEAEFTNRQS